MCEAKELRVVSACGKLKSNLLLHSLTLQIENNSPTRKSSGLTQGVDYNQLCHHVNNLVSRIIYNKKIKAEIKDPRSSIKTET